MRVTTKLTAFYDWQKVPPEVEVTADDVSSGAVKPAANGGYLARCTVKMDTHNDTYISEESIIARIIHEMMPNQGCVPHSRKEAVAQILARQVMPDQAHPKFMSGFEVHDDGGPDEALFNKMVEPYTKSLHKKSGKLLIDPEDLANLKALYLEKVSVQEHVEGLHKKFNVKKRPPAPPAPADAKAVTP